MTNLAYSEQQIDDVFDRLGLRTEEDRQARTFESLVCLDDFSDIVVATKIIEKPE